MAHYNKAPPALNKGDDYEKWKKKLTIWQKLTSFDDTKQGPALVLSLDDESQEAVLELEEEVISAEGGVESILEVLDGLYLKDKTQSAFDALEDFEGYRRPKGLSMNEFCNEFDKRYSKVKSYGTEFPVDLLGFRLLKSANLQPIQEQLAKSTITELTYDNMKTQLKKIHGSGSAASADVKLEMDEEVELVESDVLYGSVSRDRGGRSRGYGSRPGSSWSGSSRPGSLRTYRGGKARRGKNPLDQFGHVMSCFECGSVNHLAYRCPDRERSVRDNGDGRGERRSDKTEETYYHITLFQSDFDEPHRLKSLVGDSLNCGVLDCGASETVCGDVWFNSYMDSLDDVSRDKVVFGKSNNAFKFGDGKRIQSTKRVSIPAVIGSSEVMIETDVVDSDIPLLLSKRAMKNAGFELNFKDDTAMILGEKINLRVTESGHYALPLCKRQYFLDDIEHNPAVRVTLSCSKAMSAKQQAIKLHRQFAHPQKEKLLKLLKLAGKDDPELSSEIEKVSVSCKVCQEYGRPPPRPIVGLPMATVFNECVAMDLKCFGNVHLLHLINHARECRPVL